MDFQQRRHDDMGGAVLERALQLQHDIVADVNVGILAQSALRGIVVSSDRAFYMKTKRKGRRAPKSFIEKDDTARTLKDSIILW